MHIYTQMSHNKTTKFVGPSNRKETLVISDQPLKANPNTYYLKHFKFTKNANGASL